MRRAKSEYGFTPLEVLIALAVLLIGVLALMKLFPMGLQNAQIAQERLQAAGLADERLGMLRMAGSEGLIDGSTNPNFTGMANINAAFTQYQAYYTHSQRMLGAEDTHLQRVVFTVTLPDGRRESYVTYVSMI
jgi:Tfp pilus assembly protein PilV